MIVNEIMDAQAHEACESDNQRNGYRERKLTTSVGTITDYSQQKAPVIAAWAPPVLAS